MFSDLCVLIEASIHQKIISVLSVESTCRIYLNNLSTLSVFPLFPLTFKALLTAIAERGLEENVLRQGGGLHGLCTCSEHKFRRPVHSL